MAAKFQIFFCVFLAGVLLMMDNTVLEKARRDENRDYGVGNPEVKDGVTTWDKIQFGSWYQDAEVRVEPIKWRVLSVDGDDAFVLADMNLDAKPYHETYEEVTWETCTLRKWLNGDFYNEAFDDEEKKAIVERGATRDKVYLLSMSEACNKEYGFGQKLTRYSEAREAKNTDYAKLNGVWSSNGKTAGNGYWWLRSPDGGSDDTALCVTDGCGADTERNEVDDCMGAVRPAMHISLSSATVKAAGTVDSAGNVMDESVRINNPVVKDGVTTWDCVYFGSYRQGCDFKKQALEWRVLSVDGNDAFLLADKIIDAKPYNDTSEEVQWEMCTLRDWLNDEFYNTAFDKKEKKAIIETNLTNRFNAGDDTWNAYDTFDKIYLLSESEIYDTKYGFEADDVMSFETDYRENSETDSETDSGEDVETEYDFGSDDGNSDTRMAKNTDYAKVNNARSDTDEGTAGNGCWWLRLHVYGNCAVTFFDGNLAYQGDYADEIDGIRPVLHIKLSSHAWSRAGEVRSDES